MHENQKLFDKSGALCLKNNFKAVLIPQTTLKHCFKTNFEFYAPPPSGRHPDMAPTHKYIYGCVSFVLLKGV